MKKRMKVADLQIGMYIEIPGSWMDHDFLKTNFKITSDQEISELRKNNIAQVVVDIDKSEIAPEVETDVEEQLGHYSHPGVVSDPKHGEIPKDWSPTKNASDELLQAIADKHLDPERKSKIVYLHSVEMMQELLQQPTAENIAHGKEAIFAMSDLILSDDATAFNLLKITAHDFYTYTHSVNVGVTSILLAKELFKGSDAHNLHELGAGFFLHDLGKVKVRPEVLNKPGRLTDAEMKHIRIHPYQGYKLLDLAGAMTEECRIIVMQHHEFADGGGYPKRLHNDEIHLYGKICGIADVFDALTAERSYKRAMTPFEALKLMKEQMLGHFDRDLFSRFVQLF